MKKSILLLITAVLTISCSDLINSADLADSIAAEQETQTNAAALKNEDNLKLVFGSALKAVQDAIDQATSEIEGAPSFAPAEDSETFALSGSVTLETGGTITIDSATSSLTVQENAETITFIVVADLTMSDIVVAGLSGTLFGALKVDANAELDNTGNAKTAVEFAMAGTVSTTLADGTQVDFPVQATLTLNTDGKVDYDITVDGETTSFSVDADDGDGNGGNSSNAPETTISSGPEDTVTTFDNSFVFTCSLDSCTFECRLGSADFETCTSPKAYDDQEDGEYVFEVRASADGNVDATPAQREYTVDTSPAPGQAPILSDTATDGFTITWVAAIDPHSDAADLEYAVYVSSDNDLTVESVENFGIEVTPWTTNITTATATGLQSETTYTTYVLVSNERDIVSLYPTAQTQTSKAAIYLFNAGQSDGSIPDTLCANNVPVELTCNNVEQLEGNISLMSVPADAPVRGPNETLIASNWADLFDGTIENSLATAGVMPASEQWWSGNDSDGTITNTGAGVATRTCYNWANHGTDNGVQTFRGTTGSSSSTSGTWIGSGYTQFCNASHYVLCACTK